MIPVSMIMIVVTAIMMLAIAIMIYVTNHDSSEHMNSVTAIMIPVMGIRIPVITGGRSHRCGTGRSLLK